MPLRASNDGAGGADQPNSAIWSTRGLPEVTGDASQSLSATHSGAMTLPVIASTPFTSEP